LIGCCPANLWSLASSLSADVSTGEEHPAS